MSTALDEKTDDIRLEHVEMKSSFESAVLADNAQEHTMTLASAFRKHPKIILWSFFWCLCAVGWGFDTQVNGAMISVPEFRAYYGYIYEGEPVIAAHWQAAFNVVSSVGQFFGGFACSWLSDRIGRKKSLAIGVLICTGAIFGETFAPSPAAFVVFKVILGIGVGFYLTLGPITCSELAPTVLRGYTTAGVNLGIAVGQLLSNSVTKGFGGRGDLWAFRGPFLVQLAFSLALGVGCIFSPESPWYLVRKGKIDKARDTLQSLYGANTDISVKLASIQATVNAESALEQPTYATAFKGTNRPRTLVSIGAFACQHVVGIIFVLGFSTYFFQLAGLDTEKSFDLGVSVTACGVFGNICSWFVVNRFGRRIIFNSGMVGLTTILFLIGILDVIPTGAAKWVQASLTVVYSFVYFLTLGAMAFVLLGEVSSPVLRAKTTALATATQAIFGIIMFFAVPYMVNPDEANLRGKVGFIFGGMSAVATIACFFFIPELKGRTVQEIDTMFHKRVPLRKMGSHNIEESYDDEMK